MVDNTPEITLKNAENNSVITANLMEKEPEADCFLKPHDEPPCIAAIPPYAKCVWVTDLLTKEGYIKRHGAGELEYKAKFFSLYIDRRPCLLQGTYFAGFRFDDKEHFFTAVCETVIKPFNRYFDIVGSMSLAGGIICPSISTLIFTLKKELPDEILFRLALYFEYETDEETYRVYSCVDMNRHIDGKDLESVVIDLSDKYKASRYFEDVAVAASSGKLTKEQAEYFGEYQKELANYLSVDPDELTRLGNQLNILNRFLDVYPLRLDNTTQMIAAAQAYLSSGKPEILYKTLKAAKEEEQRRLEHPKEYLEIEI